MKQPNKVGGGAQTNVHGLWFEQVTELASILRQSDGFEVDGKVVKKNGQAVATLLGKNALYRDFLEKNGINYKLFLSKKLLPDEALLVGSTLFILEKKFQHGAGSVDEKLQTCDFKKKQYTKLLKPLGIKVEYIYIFNDWFKKHEYDDVRNYILSVGCKYFFNEIPLHELDLLGEK